jgi:molybdenum cofactor cytidylyltransferase
MAGDGLALKGPAGLVLAAGGGTRFGAEPKQLADLEGRPLLEWAVRAQCAVAELERVVVVLGAHAAEVARGVEFGRAEIVVCPDWESGQAASLRRGLQAVADAATVVVTLGDAPLVTPQVIRMFVGEPPRTRAVYHGRPGHPVVLGPAEISALMSHQGDQGARGLLRSGRVIEVGRICSGRDVDTPDDLEEIRHEARAVI